MDTSLISLSMQTAAAAVIGVLTLLLARTVRRAYVWDWTLAWLHLAIGLGALLVGLKWPAAWVPVIAAGLMAHYVFGFLLVAGCSNYASGATITPRHRRWLLLGAAPAIAFAALSRSELDLLFLLHSPVLGVFFLVAWRKLAPARKAHPGRTGLAIASIGLLLLGIDALHYVPVFAWAEWQGDHHVAYLRYHWLYDLIFQTVFAFGMIMLVMETVAADLEDTNRELAAARDRIERQARIDPLTEVLNRHAFYSMFAAPPSAQPAEGCAVVLDVDNLKRLNDAFGHSAGDAAIRAAAKTIRSVIRPDDVLFRWGGDEFLVLLFGVGEEEARARMRALDQVATGGASGSPALSWGVARFDTERTVSAAIERADRDMYAHREERRMHATVNERLLRLAPRQRA